MKIDGIVTSIAAQPGAGRTTIQIDTQDADDPTCVIIHAVGVEPDHFEPGDAVSVTVSGKKKADA